MTPQDKKEEWRERFAKFNNQWEEEGFLSMEELEDFISQELALASKEERERIVEMLDILKCPMKHLCGQCKKDGGYCHYGAALSDLKENVKKFFSDKKL